jgi:putative flippase GtrA
MSRLSTLWWRVGEPIRYATVSLIGFILDFFTIWLLTTTLHMHFAVAAAVGFMLGSWCVYWLSVRLVFGYRRLTSVVVESSTFIAIGMVGLVANVALISMLVTTGDLHVLIAKPIASAITLLLNYALRKFALFSPKAALTSKRTKKSIR